MHEHFLELLARRPELTSAEVSELDAHLAGCPECRAAAADYARQTAMLRAMPLVQPPTTLRRGVLQRVNTQAPVPFYRRPWAAFLPLAAATAVVIAVAIAQLRPAINASHPAALAPTPTPAHSLPPFGTQSAHSSPDRARTRKQRVRPRRTATRQVKRRVPAHPQSPPSQAPPAPQLAAGPPAPSAPQGQQAQSAPAPQQPAAFPTVTVNSAAHALVHHTPTEHVSSGRLVPPASNKAAPAAGGAAPKAVHAPKAAAPIAAAPTAPRAPTPAPVPTAASAAAPVVAVGAATPAAAAHSAAIPVIPATPTPTSPPLYGPAVPFPTPTPGLSVPPAGAPTPTPTPTP